MPAWLTAIPLVPVATTTTDAPLVDLIFPNRGTPGPRPRVVAAPTGPGRAASTSHRKTGGLSRLFGAQDEGHPGGVRADRAARWPAQRGGRAAGPAPPAAAGHRHGRGRRRRGRRRGRAADRRHRLGGDGKGRPNTAVEGLGAAGLAESPAAAARIAAAATPTWPTPLWPRPRAAPAAPGTTFGPTLLDVVAVQADGHRRLARAAVQPGHDRGPSLDADRRDVPDDRDDVGADPGHDQGRRQQGA